MIDNKQFPFFSIIVPVYNVEDYLNECINSVLSQTIKDYELILVDDGSEDNSGKICDEYEKKDGRIRVIHKENGGLSSARNCGIKNAHGKYLLFLDSDDFWNCENCLEILKDAVKEPYDIVMYKASKYFDGVAVDSYGDYNLKITNSGMPGEIVQYMVKKHKQLACAWNKMVSCEYVLKNNIFFLEGIIGEDIDWNIRLFKDAQNIRAINRVLYMYRQNRVGSITNTISQKNLNDLFNIIKMVADEYKQGESTFDNAVKNFMAYEYAIFLYMYPMCSSNITLSDVKQYKWLLQYATDKKSKIIKAIYKIFGYNKAVEIIKMLRKIK